MIKTASQIRLPLERVFCVKNRSQAQNEENLKLAVAREEEDLFFSEHGELGGLPSACKGIKALSRMLVQLQFERIKQTLPLVASKVRQRIAELEREMLPLRLPGTAAAARTHVQLLLVQVERSLQEEWRGRVSLAPAVRKRKRLVECVQLPELEIKDLATARKAAKFGAAGEVEGEKVDNHGVAWHLSVYPQYALKETVEKQYGVGAFINWDLPANIECVEYDYEISASFNGKEIASSEDSYTAKGSIKGFGSRSFISYKVAETCMGPVTFSGQVFPSVIEYKAAKEETEVDGQQLLLCASVRGLDEAFCKKIHGLYPNKFFFSTGFRDAVKEQVLP